MNYPKSKRQAYVKFILRMLLGASTLYIGGLLNPSRSTRILKTFQRFSAQELSQLRRVIRNLEKQRRISIVEKGEDAEISLTPLGRKEAMRVQIQDLTIPHSTQWDHKWRLVIFDVPEYLKVGRDALRNTLNRLGLYQVQKSVFLYPYPCENEIEAVARAFEFENYVHCFTVEAMKDSYRKQLMKHFKL